LGLCERVVDIKCGADIIPLDGMCRITETMCSGIPTVFTIQDKIDPGCTVSKVTCLKTLVDCTEHVFGCVGCHYTIAPEPCSDQCIQSIPGLVCRCPVDFRGVACERHRNINCEMTPIIPPEIICPNYKSYDKFSLCISAEGKESIELEYNISCSFVNFEYDKAAVQKSDLPYVWIGDNIAISDPDVSWYFRTIAHDLNRISDRYEDRATMQGWPEGILRVIVNLTTIPANYSMIANNLYVEQLLGSTVPYNNTKKEVFRILLKRGETAGGVYTFYSWIQKYRDELVGSLIIGSFLTLIVGAIISKVFCANTKCCSGGKQHTRIGNE